MKRLLVGLVVVAAVAGSACVIEASTSRCWDDGTCTVGASCDYNGDMDCISNSQAWWCSGGLIYQIDCTTNTAAQGGCVGTGTAYAACGHISPCRPDAQCICSNDPAVCGATVTMGSCTGQVVCGY